MGRAKKTKRKASVVDLFCGAGGLSYGFKSEGSTLAAGIDIDEACRFPYVTNNRVPFIRTNVGALTADEVEALFDPNATRVLIGCAPGQPFSTYNQKNEDPNWRLLQSFGSLIDEVRPDVVDGERPATHEIQGWAYVQQVRFHPYRRGIQRHLERALWAGLRNGADPV